MLECLVRMVCLDVIDALFVAADVAAGVVQDHPCHFSPRRLVPVRQGDRIGFGFQASQIIRAIRAQVGQIPGRQRIYELAWQRCRGKHQNIVEITRHTARRGAPSCAPDLPRHLLVAAIDLLGDPDGFVIIIAPLSGIGRPRARVKGPIRRIDSAHPSPPASIGGQARWREPQVAQPVLHRLVRLILGQAKGQDALRLDLAAGPGVGDNRRGTKGAGTGMGGIAQLDLGAAIGTGQQTNGLSQLGSGIQPQALVQRDFDQIGRFVARVPLQGPAGFRIGEDRVLALGPALGLARRRASGTGADGLAVPAPVADQHLLARLKAQAGPALLAGVSVFGLWRGHKAVSPAGAAAWWGTTPPIPGSRLPCASRPGRVPRPAFRA